MLLLGGIGMIVVVGGLIFHPQQSDPLPRNDFLDEIARAEQGDARSQYNLGICYYNGRLAKKDYAQAVKWFRKAAEQNFALAQYNLGYCYKHGMGVPVDQLEAAKWIRKAAEQNDAPAQYLLGWWYKHSVGVPKDDMEAVNWYRKAAEQGYCPANLALGGIYANGEGVAKDEVEAFAMYDLADFFSAANDRDRLATTMSPQQVIAGKKRSEELRSRIDAKRKSSGK